MHSAPYHPSTNGLAERAVQVFKRAMRKSEPGELQTKLARFLLRYRTTPHATTGQTPAELLMGRTLRTHLDMLKPNLEARVGNKQLLQQRRYDDKAKERSLEPGNEVYVRTAGSNSPWIPGKIEVKQGLVQYRVILRDGRRVIKHIDHIQFRKDSTDQESEMLDTFDPYVNNPIASTTPTEDTTTGENPSLTAPVALRRSTRIHHSPDCYGEWEYPSNLVVEECNILELLT